MRTSRSLAVLAATAVAGALVAVPGAEAAAPTSKTLTRHLLSPLSVAVDGSDVYVTQNFGGTLSKLRPGKSPKTLYHAKGGNEVGGVSVRKGHVVFTETASDPETGEPSDSWVKKINRKGKVRTIANMRTYENANNPDQVITYGVSDLDEDCAAQWPTDDFGPVSYPGHPDSHPYATYQTAKTDLRRRRRHERRRRDHRRQDPHGGGHPGHERADHRRTSPPRWVCRSAPWGTPTAGSRCRPTSSSAPAAS